MLKKPFIRAVKTQPLYYLQSGLNVTWNILQIIDLHRFHFILFYKFALRQVGI